MSEVAIAIVLFLPAGIANMTPVFANKIPLLNRWQTAMDFGRSFHGIRIFGDHKTWRGFVTGTALAAMTALLLLPLIDIASGQRAALMGIAMGVGALGADAIKSFFKRRVGVKPGATWFPFDQLDYVIGSQLLLLPFDVLTLQRSIAITLFYFVAVLVSTHIGYWLGLKDSPI